MSMENIRDLYLEDETFEDARQKFNTVLQRLFRSMIDTESNEGSITLKMDVSMQTEKTWTETRERFLMAIMKLITPDMTTRIRKSRRNKERGGL